MNEEQKQPGNEQPIGDASEQLRFPRLIDIPAVAHRLGVGVRHVRGLVASRRISFIKWGYLIRFDERQIEEWLKNAEHPMR
jgi:excisionase family DNA binding protein